MKHSGFTLIELLIVVAIIGILAAIAVPNFVNAHTRSRIARVQAEMKSLKIALEMYKTDTAIYPYDGNDYEAFNAEKFNQKNIQRVLTSPVSYISEIVYDPFNPNFVDEEDQMFNMLFDIPPHPYIYFTVGGFNFHQGNTSEYTLFSLGPDQDFDNASTSKETTIKYNATNGLYSNGDIVIFGP